jgi:hypothetical protein
MAASGKRAPVQWEDIPIEWQVGTTALAAIVSGLAGWVVGTVSCTVAGYNETGRFGAIGAVFGFIIGVTLVGPASGVAGIIGGAYSCYTSGPISLIDYWRRFSTILTRPDLTKKVPATNAEYAFNISRGIVMGALSIVGGIGVAIASSAVAGYKRAGVVGFVAGALVGALVLATPCAILGAFGGGFSGYQNGWQGVKNFWKKVSNVIMGKEPSAGLEASTKASSSTTSDTTKPIDWRKVPVEWKVGTALLSALISGAAGWVVGTVSATVAGYNETGRFGAIGAVIGFVLGVTVIGPASGVVGIIGGAVTTFGSGPIALVDYWRKFSEILTRPDLTKNVPSTYSEYAFKVSSGIVLGGVSAIGGAGVAIAASAKSGYDIAGPVGFFVGAAVGVFLATPCAIISAFGGGFSAYKAENSWEGVKSFWKMMSNTLSGEEPTKGLTTKSKEEPALAGVAVSSPDADPAKKQTYSTLLSSVMSSRQTQTPAPSAPEPVPVSSPTASPKNKSMFDKMPSAPGGPTGTEAETVKKASHQLADKLTTGNNKSRSSK